jgi:hypothetical protein
VGLRGPVCPQFVDSDGDGLCTGGVDRDGDGTCVSRGEVAPADYGPELPIAVPLLDFEGTPPGMVLTDAEVAPHHTRGAASGALTPSYAEDWYVLPAPALITHRALVAHATVLGRGDWPHAAFALIAEGGAGYDPADIVGRPGRWVQYAFDVSDGCGEGVTYLMIQNVSDWMWNFEPIDELYFHGDTFLIDDIGLAGEPCAEFIDTDGDAACREGLDTDSDGLCVSAGEPTPGTVQDPDE